MRVYAVFRSGCFLILLCLFMVEGKKTFSGKNTCRKGLLSAVTENLFIKATSIKSSVPVSWTHWLVKLFIHFHLWIVVSVASSYRSSWWLSWITTTPQWGREVSLFCWVERGGKERSLVSLRKSWRKFVGEPGEEFRLVLHELNHRYCHRLSVALAGSPSYRTGQ